MKYTRMARAGAGVFKGHITGRPDPMFVILAVTDRCNSNCNYCKIPQRGNVELTFGQIRDLIDQISDLGCQRLGLWGGEPLIRDDIGEIVDYAVSKGLYVTLDSNGYLYPEKADQLKNLSHLILSIDGPKKAHDANRIVGGFDMVYDALKVAKERKIKTWTITVLTENNINDESLDELLDLADELNFMPTFQLLYHGDTMGDSVSMKPSDDEYRDVLKRLVEKKKQGRRIGTSVKCFKHLIEWPDYRRNKSSESSSYFKCWGGKFYANVDTNGKIYPCSVLVDEMDALNYLDVGFEKALAHVSSPPCKKCIATCYSEYNMLFSLDFKTIGEWVRAFRR